MTGNSDSLPLEFDPQEYLRINVDVAAARVDPVDHYPRWLHWDTFGID